MYGKNFKNKKRRRGGRNPFNRADALPIKKISREKLNEAIADYLKRGGKITKITDEDVLSRRDFFLSGPDESYNFLNGD